MKKAPEGISPVLPNSTILVGFDFTHGEDNRIMIVGRKQGKTIEILNAFQGDEAEELFRKLTIPASKENAKLTLNADYGKEFSHRGIFQKASEV